MFATHVPDGPNEVTIGPLVSGAQGEIKKAGSDGQQIRSVVKSEHAPKSAAVTTTTTPTTTPAS
jgi:hypothetical protein